MSEVWMATASGELQLQVVRRPAPREIASAEAARAASSKRPSIGVRIGRLKLFTRKFVIGSPEDPLLYRWILFRVPAFGIFLHKFFRSDHALALHDHPWPFASLILKGGYIEVHDDGEIRRRPGDFFFRAAKFRHRVVLEGNRPSWSLIFVGRRARRWGFWPNNKFCFWKQYNQDLGICDESISVSKDDD